MEQVMTDGELEAAAYKALYGERIPDCTKIIRIATDVINGILAIGTSDKSVYLRKVRAGETIDGLVAHYETRGYIDADCARLPR
jgi:hypothetical protein